MPITYGKGYCEPLPSKHFSILCSYKFNLDKTGSYTCQKFTDLRCTNENKEKTELKFTFRELEKSKKVDGVTLQMSFPSGDFSEEKDLLLLYGDAMSLHAREVTKRDGTTIKDTASRPFFYTRE